MNAFRFESLSALTAPLPEDVEHLREIGDFDGAARHISLWLSRKIPDVLRDRLLLEKEILRRLPEDYPYSETKMKLKLRKYLPGLTEKEFHMLSDEGRLDWVFVAGEKHYFVDAVDVVLNDPAWAKRNAAELHEPYEEYPEGYDIVRSTISTMKSAGTCAASFKVHAEIRIKDSAFHPGVVRAWLPIPNDARQQSEIRLLDYTKGDRVRVEIAKLHAPQRTIYFEEAMTENHPFFVEYSFTNRVNYTDLWCDEYRTSPQDRSGGFTDEDLAEQLPHIQFTPLLTALSKSITEGLTTPLEKARAIYDYVTKNIRYSYMRNYFTIIRLAEYPAIMGKGDCGIQSLLFITLCRIAGIPARWQSGNSLRPPKRVGSHDWAEFYIRQYGWLFADCSFGSGGYAHGDEERRKFYFGNLDPFRDVANSAFQKQLAPSPKYIRRDPYDNQSGEIEYQERPLSDQEIETEKYMMEWKLI